MEPKPRFTVATVSTTDKEKALHMLDVYSRSNMKHEDIYFMGIKEVEKSLDITKN